MAIVERLRAKGHEALLAGGCVRDELLGREPTDYDIATDATPERVRELFPRSNAVGAAFGVVLVNSGRGEGRVTTEVATFREDGAYTDKRRPDSVVFSNAEADARRRDFTVNALFLDPLDGSADGRGRVIDYVGGQADLEARVIRAVGDPAARLGEDHLRALRAVRFSCRLGFEIEAATAEAVRTDAANLSGVSRERIGDELRKMLRARTRAAAAALLTRLGLDVPVLKEERDGDRSGVESLPLLTGLPAEGVGVPLALAAWGIDRGLDFHDGAARAALVKRRREGLCLSNEERDTLTAVLEHLSSLTRAEGWLRLAVEDQKRAAVSAGFDGALGLAGVIDTEAAAAVRERLETLRGDGIGLEPAALVDGEDLMRLGMEPGPAFARILKGVYDAQLRGEVLEKTQAERLAAELAAAMGV